MVLRSRKLGGYPRRRQEQGFATPRWTRAPRVPGPCGSHGASLGGAWVAPFLANAQGLPDAGAVVLKRQHAALSLGGLVNTQVAGAQP